MNIDASRVATEDSFSLKSGDTSGLCGTNDVWTKPWKSDTEGLARRQIAMLDAVARANTLGRFPANILHTGDSVLSAFPDAIGAIGVTSGSGFTGLVMSRKGHETAPRGDVGSASRFFKQVRL